MSDNSIEEFQKAVGGLLIRNTNTLDILTKCQISCGKICRSTIKAATGCGCVKISGVSSPIDFNENVYEHIKKHSGIEGTLCKECQSKIENEIGESFFYLASLCNALGISMKEIMNNEIKKTQALGKYNLK